jgi:hypothetical protein
MMLTKVLHAIPMEDVKSTQKVGKVADGADSKSVWVVE